MSNTMNNSLEVITQNGQKTSLTTNNQLNVSLSEEQKMQQRKLRFQNGSGALELSSQKVILFWITLL